MNNRRASWALVALVLSAAFAAVSGASAQQEPPAEETTSLVTFYGHVFGHTRAQPMPMNTQFPVGAADYSLGSYDWCGGPALPCEESTSPELWLYSTAGFVQVKQRELFSYDLIHNERGLTKDTSLDTSKEVIATVYMSADAHAWPSNTCDPGVPADVPIAFPCWNWDPGYLPQWQVEATLFTGVLGEHGGAATEAPDIAAAFADGKLTPLAQGVSEPQDVLSLEAAGEPTAWKFDINLGAPERGTIAKEESYVVRFRWYSLLPDGSQGIPPPLIWNLNGGEQYPASITLPVKGAFNVEMVLPQFVYDKLVILGIMNTPWGSYDVDHDSIKLDVRDAGGQSVPVTRITRLADFSVAHDGHYKPVNVTYVWDYQQEKLKPGDYTVTISGANFQGSASASCTGGFTLRDDGTPGDIRVGECGVRTISDDQLGKIKEGSKQDAGQGLLGLRFG